MCLHPLNARDVLGKGRKLHYTWLGIRASLDVCLHLLSNGYALLVDWGREGGIISSQSVPWDFFHQALNFVSSSMMCLSACVSGELH